MPAVVLLRQLLGLGKMSLTRDCWLREFPVVYVRCMSCRQGPDPDNDYTVPNRGSGQPREPLALGPGRP